MTAEGLLTQDLADKMLASKSVLDAADPELDDPEAAMQALFDFNAAFQAWGQNVTNVLSQSTDLLQKIGPQGRAGLLHSPLLVGCADVVSLKNSMDAVQNEVDKTKNARDKMLAVDRDKDFDKFETEYRNWRGSYKNTTTKAKNEVVKSPPAAAAGTFMAGATAVVIGVVGGAGAVVTAPAILTIAAVGIGTGVAVNWLWDFLTPQPNGLIRQGVPLAAPLSTGEACRFVSNSSQNGQPSVFADTGVGDLHIFMEDRAPLVFENFSINSGEQVTLTVDAPALDGVTAEEIADAIDDAEITVEDLEDEVEPEPTEAAAPTPTQQQPTEEPASDLGLTNLTASEVKSAVEQFSRQEGWDFTDRDAVIENERFFNFGSQNLGVAALQTCDDGRCFSESANYVLTVRFISTPQSQDDTYLSRRDLLCTPYAIKSTVYRSALIELSGWEDFKLETVRVNGIPVPPDDVCEGFSTELIQEEVHRLFDEILFLLGP